MVCDPGSLNINIPTSPPIPIPGFGLEIAPIQIPFPNISLPTGLIEDLQGLVEKLKMLFPSSTFKPTIDTFTKKAFDLIASLLTQLAPFLSFYNFIMALFNLIMCIIEVICAIPNPFKLVPAIIKLFSKCLPAFLLLFPFFALIAMIIALILLIIALIEYIITAILAIILELIRNVQILVSAISFQDADSVFAAINKIAELTCLIQNILAILGALSAIVAIINALSLFGGSTVCDDCCTAEVCPDFIKNSPITSTTGSLVYTSQVGVDMDKIMAELGATVDPGLFKNTPPIRTERWQLFDTDITKPYKFIDIMTPVDDGYGNEFIFWPEGIEFNYKTPVKKACYSIDMTLTVNPSEFGIPDIQGARKFVIKDCVAVRAPYMGVYDSTETLILSNFTGTLNIEGGKVYEEDGTTPYMVTVDGVQEQASLNTFIHKESDPSTTIPNDTQPVFTNVEYTWKPGFEALMSYQLITAGCMPEIRIEKGILNAMLGAEDIRAVIEKLPPTPAGKKVPSTGIMPNVDGTLACANQALNDFRADVTLESVALLQANLETCLNDLRDQALSTACAAIIAAVSQFKSTATLSTDTEFTTRPITVTVNLKDPAGTDLGFNIPVSCLPSIIEKMKVEPTLGEVSGFEYDGTSKFTALLTSSEAGSGTMTVSFDNKVFSILTPAVINVSSSSISETVLNYTFIDAAPEPVVRRDASDASKV